MALKKKRGRVEGKKCIALMVFEESPTVPFLSVRKFRSYSNFATQSKSMAI